MSAEPEHVAEEQTPEGVLQLCDPHVLTAEEGRRERGKEKTEGG
jgi:hypothetical protein